MNLMKLEVEDIFLKARWGFAGWEFLKIKKKVGGIKNKLDIEEENNEPE